MIERQEAASNEPVSGDLAPQFDEKAFLRKAKSRSVRRAAVISLAVVVATLALLIGGFVALEFAGAAQDVRIDNYYPILTSLSVPNTWLFYGNESDSRGFEGRTREYRVVRMAGSTPVDAGTYRLDYDVWGGEQMTNVGAGVLVGERTILENGVPELRFVFPEGEVGPGYSDRGRLAAVPASATVEVAVSFDATMTREALLERMPDDVMAMWGAIETGADPGEGGYGSPSAGHMLGLPLADDLFYEGEQAYPEDQLVERLETIAKFAPKGTADMVTETAAYIANHDIAYYGVVVAGPRDSVLRLVEQSDVRFISLGAVLQPWEVLPTP